MQALPSKENLHPESSAPGQRDIDSYRILYLHKSSSQHSFLPGKKLINNICFFRLCNGIAQSVSQRPDLGYRHSFQVSGCIYFQICTQTMPCYSPWLLPVSLPCSVSALSVLPHFFTTA